MLLTGYFRSVLLYSIERFSSFCQKYNQYNSYNSGNDNSCNSFPSSEKSGDRHVKGDVIFHFVVQIVEVPTFICIGIKALRGVVSACVFFDIFFCELHWNIDCDIIPDQLISTYCFYLCECILLLRKILECQGAVFSCKPVGNSL